MSDDARHKTLVDGKAVKLRASCDACNESKVRCSQTKPTCARCQKQVVRCIYGLSRRSHKTASRIGASSRLESSSTSCSANSDSHTSPATALSHLNSNAAGTHALIDTTHQPLESLTTSSVHWSGEDTPRATTSDMLLPTSLQDYNVLGCQPGSSEDEHISQLDFDFLDFAAVDSSVPFDAAFDLLNEVSSTLEPHDKSQSLSQSLPSYQNGGSPSCSSLLRAAILDKRDTSYASSCRCISEVIPQLLSTPFLFQGKAVKLDVQLSQLKGAMKSCEDCIKCECTSSDKLAMLTVGILVGRIVEGFETTLEEAASTSRPSTASLESSLSVTSEGSSCPQFSWGVLQIDGEDEANLRQHLWLLHFRKLEAVLKQFNASIRPIRNTQGSSVSSQVMACECMHMWLDQRAQVLRNRFFARVGPGPTS